MDTDYLSKSGLKSEYGLTDSLIKQLGEPDQTKPNPHYKSGPPMQLYERGRVERWIVKNQALIRSRAKSQQTARKGVQTKRANALQEIAILVDTLQFYSMPGMDELMLKTAAFQQERYGHDHINPKSICSYVRHHYTNYHDILQVIQGKVGASELYEHAKVLLCCRIIRHLGWEDQLTPLHAADVALSGIFTTDDLNEIEAAMCDFFELEFDDEPRRYKLWDYIQENDITQFTPAELRQALMEIVPPDDLAAALSRLDTDEYF